MLIKGNGGRTPGGMWLGPASAMHFLYPDEAFDPHYEKRGEKAEFSGSGDLTGVWELTADKIPPGGYVSVLFFTSDGPEATNYIRFASIPVWQSPPHPETIPDTNELQFCLEGAYQFQALNKPGRQHFLVPIEFDTEQRTLSAVSILPDKGHWHPVIPSPY